MTLTTFTFFIILGTCAIGTVAIPSKVEDDVKHTLTCGGELSEFRGTISYKADVPVAPNERCVWTIRHTTALSYTLDVLSFGLHTKTGDTGIIATCISNNGTGIATLNSTCHVLVLTYFTGEIIENSQGFSMFYEVDSSGSNEFINATSKHYVVNSGEGHLRHPLNVNEVYTNLELSTFVFAPIENAYDPERKTVVRYVVDNLEHCTDFLDVLKFHPVTAWRLSHRACNQTIYEKFESDDVIMVVFVSDSSVTGRGFHLIHSHEPKLLSDCSHK